MQIELNPLPHPLHKGNKIRVLSSQKCSQDNLGGAQSCGLVVGALSALLKSCCLPDSGSSE